MIANTGWPEADIVIGAALLVVVTLTVVATFVDAFLNYRGEDTFALITVFVATIGCGVVRGIIWHWAWWLHRWADASLFGDFVIGTLIFFAGGAVVGAIVGYFLRLVLALPQSLLFKALNKCGRRL